MAASFNPASMTSPKPLPRQHRSPWEDNNVVANAGFAGGFQYGGIGTRAGVTFAW
jgi:hypothetical protein